ncbi:MAG: hypothetical protein EPN40_06055 [Rhodanobacteraceae bacterium]|nr:MAG: hypothetical protein EPN40_06055 [Rhodanobacteraceae bacterium]
MSNSGKSAARKPELQTANTREVNATRVSRALRLAYHNGGWITTKMVALAIFHTEAKNRLTYAQRLAASAVKAGYLLARRLPTRNQASVYVLTKLGAAWIKGDLKATGWLPDIRVGTTWGEHNRGKGWRPPTRWLHDERAARFLCYATHALNPSGKATWKALTESQLRRMNPLEIENFGKCPDGLLVRFGSEKTKAVWVEVEQSHKTGANRRKLLAHLATLAAGKGPQLRIGSGPFDFARVGKQAFLVFPTVDSANGFERAAGQWIQRHLGSRLLWQVVIDGDDGLKFEMGRVVDMGTPRNAAHRAAETL